MDQPTLDCFNPFTGIATIVALTEFVPIVKCLVGCFKHFVRLLLLNWGSTLAITHQAIVVESIYLRISCVIPFDTS